MSSSMEIIYENKNVAKSDKKISFIHFNDVYNVESAEIEPVGGAARFLSALEYIKKRGPALVIFSGDALSPSTISMFVKGKQIIDVLNKCNIACACIGNHEFDFGVETLISRIQDSNFPWLMSNVFDAETNLLLEGVKDKHIVEFEGLKVGFIGLIENEWLVNLATINPDDVYFEYCVDAGKRLAIELKNEHKCDLVIAITHMSWPNDTFLAQKVPEIDLILGGHDHDYFVKQINNKWVIKSGMEFRWLTTVDMVVTDNKSEVVKIEKHSVDSSFPEDAETKSLIDSYLVGINKELETVLGYVNVELEGRTNMVRTQETNLGNFLTDIMLEAVNADVALLNSGCLKSDMVHSVGDFTNGDLRKILAYIVNLVVISMTGEQLQKTLENAVSKYPEPESCFLQVSGLSFVFDPSKPIGERVDPRLIKIQDEYIKSEKEYSVVISNYMKSGKSGFDLCAECPVLIEEEQIPVLFNLVLNHFKTIEDLKKNKTLQKYRSSIIPLKLVNRLIFELSEDPSILPIEEETPPSETANKMNFFNTALLVTKMLSHKQKVLSRKQRMIIKQSNKYKLKIEEYEEKAMRLAPEVEGRIICIQSQEDLENLLSQVKLNN